MPYELHGAPPAGDYRLIIQGYQPTMDAMVRARLGWRSSAGERELGVVTASAVSGVDGGFPGDLTTSIHGDAVTPSCGDQLVLTLTLISGGSPYSNIEAILTTP